MCSRYIFLNISQFVKKVAKCSLKYINISNYSWKDGQYYIVTVRCLLFMFWSSSFWHIPIYCDPFLSQSDLLQCSPPLHSKTVSLRLQNPSNPIHCLQVVLIISHFFTPDLLKTRQVHSKAVTIVIKGI